MAHTVLLCAVQTQLNKIYKLADNYHYQTAVDPSITVLFGQSCWGASFSYV